MGKLPARPACRWARRILTLIHLAVAGWLLWLSASCIWPGHCGEGFAAGYVVAAIVVYAAAWAALWLLSEGLMLLCKDGPTDISSDA